MPHNRFFHPGPLEENDTVVITGEEWRHLALSHRARVGDCVELVNGRNQLATGTVSELRKNAAAIALTTVVAQETKTPLILAQALPRMNHLEWIIEKGTELNATHFWLFPGDWSEKESLSPNQVTRLEHLCISAMKQCGRLDLPSIEIKPSLSKWESLEGTLLFGDVSPNAPFIWDLSLKRPVPSPVIFFVGPERGFSQQEEAYLQDKLRATGVRIHPNILRAETAPLTALSLLQPLISS